MRVTLWPGEGKPSITAVPYAGTVVARVRSLLSWGALAAALLGLMLGHWTWRLLPSDAAAMPPAAWEASEEAGRVFGAAAAPTATATAVMGNVKLIGVFANRTKGFAIMQVDDKQIGVAQGDDVKPGVRLVETHPDYVLLDQGGVRTRVMLSGAPASQAAVSQAAIAPAAPVAPEPTPAGQSMPERGPAAAQPIDMLRRQFAPNSAMPTAQREEVQRRIDNATRGSR